MRTAPRRGEEDITDHERALAPFMARISSGCSSFHQHRDRPAASRRQPLGRAGAEAADHACGEGRLSRGAALAAEEAARICPRRSWPALHVDGQQEEVDVADVAHRRGAQRAPGVPSRRTTEPLAYLAGSRSRTGSRTANLEEPGSHQSCVSFSRLRFAASLSYVPFRTRERLAAGPREERLSTCARRPRVRRALRRFEGEANLFTTPITHPAAPLTLNTRRARRPAPGYQRFEPILIGRRRRGAAARAGPCPRAPCAPGTPARRERRHRPVRASRRTPLAPDLRRSRVVGWPTAPRARR